MKTEEISKPDIRIVAIDESEFWNDESLEKAGKIANVYVFDANVATHLCSFAPSYWLEYIDFITKNQIDDDEWDTVHNVLASEDQSNYYGKNILTANYTTYDFSDDFPGYEDQELYDEWFNDILEFLRCNQSYFELDCMKKLGWE